MRFYNLLELTLLSLTTRLNVVAIPVNILMKLCLAECVKLLFAGLVIDIEYKVKT